MKNVFIILFLLISVNVFGQFRNNNPRIFNVKTFGAKGDGTTDDTKKIQDAINAAYLAGGGKVYFPDGIYLLSDTVITSYTFSGGIRYGAGNSQLYIPCNQTPFQTHPIVSIEFVGEHSPNMFMSRLVPYPINRSGVILYSTATGIGDQAILGAAGDAWAYGNINDAQVSIKNINFRVEANIASTGPTMGAIDLHKISSIGYFEDVFCDIDTALFYAVYPTTVTFGIYFPYGNNSAFSPINNCSVGGYKYGFRFSEHTTGNNLSASVNEFGYQFTGDGQHGMSFNRILAQWNKYSVATATPNFASATPNLNISQLEIEQDTVTSSWTFNRYTLYDSTNVLKGDITYENAQRGVGINNASFNKLGGTNALLRLRYLGQYPDTTSTIGFVTHNKFTTDSTAFVTSIATKEPALGNPASNGYLLSSTTGGVRSWIPPATGGGSIFTRYGPAGSDSLRAFANSYYRVGIYDTGYARFSVTTNLLGTTVSDTSGIKVLNTTAASSGNQQYSPVIALTGRGWGTTGGVGNRAVTFGTYVQPVQAGTPSGNLITYYSFDGGAPTTVMTLSSGGALTIPSSAIVNGAFSSNNLAASFNAGLTAGLVTVARTSVGTTSTDAVIASSGTNATAAVPNQWSPRYRLSGKVWDSTASASKVTDFIMEDKTISSFTPTHKLVFSSQINAGGYTEAFSLFNNGRLALTAPVTLKGYTVATLPTGNAGDMAYVTDATAPTYLATVVGGGAVVTPVFFDGTNWVCH